MTAVFREEESYDNLLFKSTYAKSVAWTDTVAFAGAYPRRRGWGRSGRRGRRPRRGFREVELVAQPIGYDNHDQRPHSISPKYGEIEWGTRLSLSSRTRLS